MSKSNNYNGTGMEYPNSERYEPGPMDGNVRAMYASNTIILHEDGNSEAWIQTDATVEITGSEDSGMAYTSNYVGDGSD